ncbi:hypothetical protein ACLMJK_005215 [Lecanora helva]
MNPSLRLYNVSSSNNSSRLSAATTSAPPNACCFVVQDTVNVRYWADYSATTEYRSYDATVHLTSITEFIDTTITNVETSTRAMTTSNVHVYDIASPTVLNDWNLATQLTKSTASLNGTMQQFHGTTVTSPANFILISSVNVISVPAVTDSNGQKACVTTSTHSWKACTLDPSPVSSLVYSGINSYAGWYYGNYGDNSSLPYHGDGIKTLPPSRTHVAISFTTPFVYIPSYTSSKSSSATLISLDAVEFLKPAAGYALDPIEKFGYVPQSLIRWIADNPVYASQYPGIGSCLPGGPYIDLGKGDCLLAAPVAPEEALPAGALTTSSQVTVTSAGCFHPGACPARTEPAKPSALPASPVAKNSAIPETQAPVAANSQKHEMLRPSPVGQSVPIPASNSPDASPMASPVPQSIPSHPESPAAQVSPISPQNVAPQTPINQPEASGSGDGTTAESPSAPNSIAPDQMSAIYQALQPGSAELATQGASEVQSAPSLLGGASSAGPQGNTVSNVASPDDIPQTQLPNHSPNAVQSQGLGAAIASAMGLSPASHPSPTVAGNGVNPEPSARPEDSQDLTVALAPSASAIIINGVTSILPAASPSGSQIISIGSQLIALNPAQPTAPANQPNSPQVSPATAQYEVNGQTIQAGGPVISISGTPINIPSAGNEIVVGGSTIPLPASATNNALPPLILGSQTITPNSDSAYIIGSQTLIPGSSAVIFSAPGNQAPTATPLTISSQIFTPNPTAFAIDGTTLTPGGSGVTIAGTPVNLVSSGKLVVGSGTISLPAEITGSSVVGSSGVVSSSTPSAPNSAGTSSGISSTASNSGSSTTASSTSSSSTSTGSETSSPSPSSSSTGSTSSSTRIQFCLMRQALGAIIAMIIDTTNSIWSRSPAPAPLQHKKSKKATKYVTTTSIARVPSIVPNNFPNANPSPNGPSSITLANQGWSVKVPCCDPSGSRPRLVPRRVGGAGIIRSVENEE